MTELLVCYFVLFGAWLGAYRCLFGARRVPGHEQLARNLAVGVIMLAATVIGLHIVAAAMPDPVLRQTHVPQMYLVLGLAWAGLVVVLAVAARLGWEMGRSLCRVGRPLWVKVSTR